MGGRRPGGGIEEILEWLAPAGFEQASESRGGILGFDPL
jgi:hypothetical protein